MFRPSPLRTAFRTYATSAESAASKAQAAAGSAAASAQAFAKNVGERAANLLGAYKEPIFYNAAVGRELVKQVYIAEKLSPPSVAQVQQTYSSFFHSAQSKSFWSNLYESGQWKVWAVYAVEAYGIFKIGEIVGRRSIVGYSLEEPKAEHAEAH